MLDKFNQLIGIQLDSTEHKEKVISAVGGFTGIFLVLYVTSHFVEMNSAGLIIASMGASAVLLFAVPHGPLSQPWPVVGGHLLSAAIGVTCYLFISSQLFAASIAVGLSIGVMYYCRCIHPPGGATALAAVVGGPEVHQLGYEFLLTPVLYNIITILMVAFVVNYPFIWRRYPASLASLVKSDKKIRDQTEQISRIPKADLEYALKSMQSFTDITETELENIYQMATQHQMDRHLSPDNIILGHYYLHGRKDGNGVIRRVIDESMDDKNMLIYKVITGSEKKKTQVSTREAFAQWAKHEVIFENGQWSIKNES
jgi:CBS domain-containing membrane protein